MTVEISAIDDSAIGSQPTERNAFLKLFGVGVIGWLVGALVLLAGSWLRYYPDSLPTAFMWTISHWWVSFSFGLLLLVGFGLVAKLPVGRALLAYALPVAILVALAGICLAVYPDSGFRIELSTYLPLVIMFYVLGLLWMSLSKGAEKVVFARAVIPSLVGGIIILGCVAVPVFAGDPFRYRDAFQFAITKTTLSAGEIRSDAIIEIRKPGNYEFATPRYSMAEILASGEIEPGIDIGKITWGAAGPPAPGKVGSFPLQIVWRKGIVPATIEELPTEENFVFLDVLDAGDGNREIYYLTAEIKP